MSNLKVRLKVDLTIYDRRLVVGTEGYTVGRYGSWSRQSDLFVGVCFPNIQTLDVLWTSLEIIDEEYLEGIEKEKMQREIELQTAQNVVKTIGPKGGFRGLAFTYTSKEGITSSEYIGFKSEAEEIEKIFCKYNIKIDKKTV